MMNQLSIYLWDWCKKVFMFSSKKVAWAQKLNYANTTEHNINIFLITLQKRVNLMYLFWNSVSFTVSFSLLLCYHEVSPVTLTESPTCPLKRCICLSLWIFKASVIGCVFLFSWCVFLHKQKNTHIKS